MPRWRLFDRWLGVGALTLLFERQMVVARSCLSFRTQAALRARRRNRRGLISCLLLSQKRSRLRQGDV